MDIKRCSLSVLIYMMGCVPFIHQPSHIKRSKARGMKKLQPSQFMLPYNWIHLQMRHAMNKQMFSVAFFPNRRIQEKKNNRWHHHKLSFICLFRRLYYKSRLDVIHIQIICCSQCGSVKPFLWAFHFRFHCGVANVFRIYIYLWWLKGDCVSRAHRTIRYGMF